MKLKFSKSPENQSALAFSIIAACNLWMSSGESCGRSTFIVNLPIDLAKVPAISSETVQAYKRLTYFKALNQAKPSSVFPLGRYSQPT